MYANQACRKPTSVKEGPLDWETKIHDELKCLILLINSYRIRQNMGKSKVPHLDVKENKILAIQTKITHIVLFKGC